jgi:hypothetical protein
METRRGECVQYCADRYGSDLREKREPRKTGSFVLFRGCVSLFSFSCAYDIMPPYLKLSLSRSGKKVWKTKKRPKQKKKKLSAESCSGTS